MLFSVFELPRKFQFFLSVSGGWLKSPGIKKKLPVLYSFFLFLSFCLFYFFLTRRPKRPWRLAIPKLDKERLQSERIRFQVFHDLSSFFKKTF